MSNESFYFTFNGLSVIKNSKFLRHIFSQTELSNSSINSAIFLNYNKYVNSVNF